MKHILLIALTCLIPTAIQAKTFLFFDNNTDLLIRVNNVVKTDNNTSIIHADKICYPGEKIKVMEIDRGTGNSWDPSSFKLSFSPDNDIVKNGMNSKAETPFDPDDYVWIPIATAHQWSKHGPFGGAVYYNIDKNSSNDRIENSEVRTTKAFKKRGYKYTFTITSDREKTSGTKNDDIRVKISGSREKIEPEPKKPDTHQETPKDQKTSAAQLPEPEPTNTK